MPLLVIYIAAALLALGAAPLPYGYYTFLRPVAFTVFAAAAFVAHQRKVRLFPFVYVALALLFNPFIKVHLPKEAWAVVDVVSALFLLGTSARIKA